MTVKVFHVKHNLQGDTPHPWCVLRTPPGIQAAGLELGPSPSRCAAGDPLPLPGPARRPARGPRRPWNACTGLFNDMGVPMPLATSKTGCAPPLFFGDRGERGAVLAFSQLRGEGKPSPGGLGARPLPVNAP